MRSLSALTVAAALCLLTVPGCDGDPNGPEARAQSQARDAADGKEAGACDDLYAEAKHCLEEAAGDDEIIVCKKLWSEADICAKKEGGDACDGLHEKIAECWDAVEAGKVDAGDCDKIEAWRDKCEDGHDG